MAENGKKANPAAKAGKAAEKVAEKVKPGPATYLVFTVGDDGNLVPVKTVDGKTPEKVVSDLVASDTKLTGKTLVVVPKRNYKVFSTEVETKTRVKVTTA